MIALALEERVRAAIGRASDTRRLPLVLAVVAFVLTLAMSVPFASVLVLAVFLQPRRWRTIAVYSALGASIGGLSLYLVFHHLGWNQLLSWYPDLAASNSWRDATRWVSAYGAWALLLIAVSPLPQTPALAFAAIARLPIAEVFLALLVGKVLKYSVYGWLVARFPERYARYFAPMSSPRA